MALIGHPTSPPRVAQWQLSPWPERDPDCQECDGAGAVPNNVQEDAVLAEIQGIPCPQKREHTQMQKEGRRMMEILGTRSLVPAKSQLTAGQIEMNKERRRAFELFQSIKNSEPHIYAFDLQQALETAGLDTDQHQISVLAHRFNLQPGDIIPFHAFNAMCDTLLTNQVPPLPSSPPREPSVPCPGSPEYTSDKKEKPPAKTPVRKNPVPYHLVMDSKMSVPQKARVQHGFGR